MPDIPKCSTEAEREARKDHWCTNCRAHIKKGQKYTHISGIWDEPRSFKLCKNCNTIVKNYTLMDESLGYEDGPTLEFGGVSEWLCGFLCVGFAGEEAVKELEKLFDVDAEYMRKQLANL